MNIRVQLSGIKEFDEMLRALPMEVQKSSTARIFSKASLPLKRTFKSEVYKATKSERVRSSVSVKVIRRKNPYAVVKVDGKRARQAYLPSNIAHLLTHGHNINRPKDNKVGSFKGISYSNWRDVAWRSAEPQIKNVMSGGYNEIIQNEYKKFQKRSAQARSRMIKSGLKKIF